MNEKIDIKKMNLDRATINYIIGVISEYKQTAEDLGYNGRIIASEEIINIIKARTDNKQYDTSRIDN